MPPQPVPSHALDRVFVTGPDSPREADRDVWAAWEAHLDAGRIGGGCVTLERDAGAARASGEIVSDQTLIAK